MKRRHFLLGLGAAGTLSGQSARPMPDMSAYQSPQSVHEPPRPPVPGRPQPSIVTVERPESAVPAVERRIQQPSESQTTSSEEREEMRAEDELIKYANMLTARGLPTKARDIYLASDAVLGEARGESIYHQGLIADVIRNRFAYDSYQLSQGNPRSFGRGNGVGDLIFGKNFVRAGFLPSRVIKTEAPRLVYESLEEYVEAAQGKKNLFAIDEAKGALYFNNPFLVKEWTYKQAKAQITGLFGRQDIVTVELPHVFYGFENDSREWQKNPVLR